MFSGVNFVIYVANVFLVFPLSSSIKILTSFNKNRDGSLTFLFLLM